MRVFFCLLASLLLAGGLHAQPVSVEFVQARFDGEGSAGLQGTEDIAVSPDGRFVYATSYLEDALNVFARDTATDSLTFVQAVYDGLGGVTGLFGPVGLVLSADGSYVYVAAEGYATVFARDATTGRLAFVQTIEDEDNGALLDDATEITLSPDGSHVYIASDFSETLTVFSRDAATGRLAVVQALENDEGGVMGLDDASGLAVSPDGRHLYVADGDSDRLSLFDRDAATGALSFAETTTNGEGGVSGISGAESLAVSADGQFVYATGRGDNAVAVFSRDATTGSLSFLAVYRDGEGGVDGLTSANGIAFSPDEAFVYVVGGSCCVATDPGTLAVFSRDASTGLLTFVEVLEDRVGGVSGLFGAGDVAVAPDGGGVYVAAFFANAVTAFDRDPSAGTLEPAGFILDGVGGAGLRGARESVISPDGRFVYVTATSDGALTIFARDPGTGALAFVGSLFRDEIEALSGASGVGISPDGAHLYVVSEGLRALVAFRRDPATGGLNVIETEVDGENGVDGLAGARRLAISPDGAHVYVAGTFDNALAAFARDPATGALDFLEVVRDGQNGVDGLNSAAGVEVSPDGENVYATGRFDDAVAVFSRDPSTGLLTFIEAQRNGTGGVEGLDNAESVRVSPDGAHVIATGPTDSALAVFARAPATGALTFLAAVREGVGGAEGLAFPWDLAISPDGTSVFVASGSGTVAVYSRDASTGGLVFSDLAVDDEGGVDGLEGAQHVSISPDGRHEYVTGSRDDAIAVFANSRPVPSENGPERGSHLVLSAPRPNPAAGPVTVRMEVRVPQIVTVELLDVLGRRVRLLHHAHTVAGTYEVPFGTESLRSGVYVVRATAGGDTRSRRIVVMR